MKLSALLMLGILASNFLTLEAKACDWVFEHRTGQKDGRIETVVENEAALEGHENCMYTFTTAQKLKMVKGKKLSVNIRGRNFSKTQKKKLAAAKNKLKQVVNSVQFRNKVLNHQFNGKKVYASTALDNRRVYSKIMTGAETLKPKKDYIIDLDVTLYYEESTVVGYTYPNTTRVWVNTKYFNKFSYASVAGNLTHEWLHKMGFDHDFEPTSRRKYSVPYGVGHIMRSMIQ